MTQDAELMRRYAEDHSETAFSELIQRHVDLVYSAALRQVNGDVHHAQDLTQQVFVELARQAKRLENHPALVGWLYTTTRLMALRMVRSEQRRAARELEANTMNELLQEPGSEPDWERLRPMLEETMHELREEERLVVLLRFFNKKSLKEVGLQLGLSENAARMRVERALDKLRSSLARKGLTSTAAGLALVLSGNAVISAPSAFVTSLSAAFLGGGAASVGASVAFFKLVTMTKLHLCLAALVIAGVATTLVQKQHASLRQEIDLLRQHVAQLKTDNAGLSNRLDHAKSTRMLRLPAPSMQKTVTPPAQDETVQFTNLLARFPGLRDKAPHKLTAAQVESYLKARGRNAVSLLAAYRTTGDSSLLEEAMKQYPNNPQVALEAALRNSSSLEERSRWLDVFKQAAPDNPLPNYLSALSLMRSGQMDQAVQDLVLASGKQHLQDYSEASLQENEQVYIAAGYSSAEAKAIAPLQYAIQLESSEEEAETFAPFEWKLAQLRQLKELGVSLVEMAKSYKQSGDLESAQSAFQMVLDLGQRYNDKSIITQLSGDALQILTLSQFDPASPYGSSTVEDAINQLKQKRTGLRELCRQATPLLSDLSEQEWNSFGDRRRLFGEAAALQWVIGKYGRSSN